MTLCRSKGEPKMQRAKGKALSVNQRMLLKGSLLHALCKNAQAHCLALEGSRLDRPHA
jgi:hypothetical protein